MFNLNAQGTRSFRSAISCSILGLAAVILRFICKRKSGNKFAFDDWWIVFALLTGWSANAVALWGAFTGGGGKEMKEILESGSKDTLHQLSNYLEGLLLAWTFYLVASFAIKISLCCLYSRIFNTPVYRKCCLGIMIITSLWLIGAQIGNFIICIPFDSFWIRTKPGRCLDFNIYALCVGVVELVLDAMILALPLKAVLGLHLPFQKKVALVCIFTLAGFVMITGIVRVKLMYQPFSIYVRFANSLIWSNVHIMTGIICACFPLYKPLWLWLDQALSRHLSKLRSTTRVNLPSMFGRSRKNTGEKPPQIGTLAPVSAFDLFTAASGGSATETVHGSESDTLNIKKSVSIQVSSQNGSMV